MKPKRSAKSMTLEQLSEAAECLKTIAHPHRLQILQLISSGPHTVGELAVACQIASPVASNHLRLMERTGLLSSRRDGKNIYYQISDNYITPILACLESRFG
jgi:DNA-binding transcriptional ArsR family regulator